MPGYGDALICGISTQLRQYIPNFDEIISDADVDFVRSGLMAPSVIRLGFLAIVPPEHSPGVIGTIDQERLHRLLSRLSNYLTAEISSTKE